jgi:hypothetical protein
VIVLLEVSNARDRLAVLVKTHGEHAPLGKAFNAVWIVDAVTGAARAVVERALIGGELCWSPDDDRLSVSIMGPEEIAVGGGTYAAILTIATGAIEPVPGNNIDFDAVAWTEDGLFFREWEALPKFRDLWWRWDDSRREPTRFQGEPPSRLVTPVAPHAYLRPMTVSDDGWTLVFEHDGALRVAQVDHASLVVPLIPLAGGSKALPEARVVLTRRRTSVADKLPALTMTAAQLAALAEAWLAAAVARLGGEVPALAPAASIAAAARVAAHDPSADERTRRARTIAHVEALARELEALAAITPADLVRILEAALRNATPA